MNLTYTILESYRSGIRKEIIYLKTDSRQVMSVLGVEIDQLVYEVYGLTDEELKLLKMMLNETYKVFKTL